MVNEERIVELLIQICRNKKIFSIDRFSESKFFRISSNGSVFLGDLENTLILQIIDEFKTDVYIRENFGSDFLRDNILEIIIASFKHSDRRLDDYVKREIKEFYRNLKKQINEHLFIFPIENLVIERKMEIGDVSFYPYSKSYQRYIRHIIWNVIKNNPQYTRKQKFAYINNYIENFEKNVDNARFSLAEVSLSGCKGPVEQIALRKIRMAITALKLYSYPNDDSNQSYFGIVGEIIRGISRSNFDFVEGNASQMNKIVGYMIPFEINTNRKKLMKNFEFGLLKKIIGKSEYNPFEQRLLTAVFWFGYAMNIQIFYEEIKKHQRPKSGYENIEYFNLNQRFFYLLVALESLLKNRDEPQFKVRRRVSNLIDNDVDEKLKKHFRKRGEIAHQGVEFVSLEQVIELTFIVQHCIFKTLKVLKERDFQEHSQFTRFVDEMGRE